MKDLVEALQIFLKYGNSDRPTHCEHDTLTVFVDPSAVSEADIGELDELGFFADKQESCFMSYKYGSA